MCVPERNYRLNNWRINIMASTRLKLPNVDILTDNNHSGYLEQLLKQCLFGASRLALLVGYSTNFMRILLVIMALKSPEDYGYWLRIKSGLLAVSTCFLNILCGRYQCNGEKDEQLQYIGQAELIVSLTSLVAI